MARKRNQKFATATVTAISHDGRGIAHIDGKLVFVDGALQNEVVTFRYLREKSNFAEGEVTEVITPSPLRQQPQCQHFGVCGGCQLQHLPTALQLEQKQRMLAELLQHQANATPAEWMLPITSDDWGYRRKARLGVKYVAGKNKVLVGFRERDARFLANLERCEILHPSVGLRVEAISDALYELDARDKIAQIEVAVDDQQTALIFRNLITLANNDIEKLRELGKQYDYKLYLQPAGIDSVYLIYPEGEKETLNYALPEQSLTFNFHPMEFTQINSEINRQLVSRTLELLTLEAEDRVLDLFCGIGNFTLAIAKHCEHVIGVEGCESAVKRASENALFNQLIHVKFYCENLFEPPFSDSWSQQQYTKLVLDPPRSGAKEIIPLLAVWQPKKIVYISCNPSTLARDSALIIAQGYRLEKAGIANMFPHTKHVESIALFESIS